MRKKIWKKKKIKSYLRELTIVTIGVLIALFLSNLKEYIQARNYYKASVESIKSEINLNNTRLSRIVEEHTNILDTIRKYSDDTCTISDLFIKSNGMKFATLYNSGLEFYEKNQMNAIDFEVMSMLINMNYTSKLIDNKLNRFTDFVYSNAFNNSKESKKLILLYLKDILSSEHELLAYYKDFTDKKGEVKK